MRHCRRSVFVAKRPTSLLTDTGATYPALAVLFSQTMDAFTTVDVPKANFYSLMFFVVALGNLVAYAVSGWIVNIIAQVGPSK